MGVHMPLRLKNRMSLYTKKAWTAQLFMLPFYFGLLFFFLRPLFMSLFMSFQEVSIGAEGYSYNFTGLENYNTAFFKDAEFTTNLLGSLGELVWKVPVILVVSIFLAQIINQKFRGRFVIRAIFFLPVIFASGVALNSIQNDFVASSALTGNSVSGGVVSQSSMLKEWMISSGMGSQVVDLATGITDSLFTMVWRSGVQMIVFLAGLQSIPSSLYEASAVEGASVWDNFWKITLPMLAPMFLINLVYTIVDSFTDTENKIMMQISNLTSQQTHKIGLSSAFSWSYFLIMGIVLALLMLIIGRTGKANSY